MLYVGLIIIKPAYVVSGFLVGLLVGDAHLARHMIEPVGLVVTGVADQRMYGYSGYGDTDVPHDADVETAPRRSRGASSAQRRLTL